MSLSLERAASAASRNVSANLCRPSTIWPCACLASSGGVMLPKFSAATSIALPPDSSCVTACRRAVGAGAERRGRLLQRRHGLVEVLDVVVLAHARAAAAGHEERDGDGDGRQRGKGAQSGHSSVPRSTMVWIRFLTSGSTKTSSSPASVFTSSVSFAGSALAMRVITDGPTTTGAPFSALTSALSRRAEPPTSTTSAVASPPPPNAPRSTSTVSTSVPARSSTVTWSAPPSARTLTASSCRSPS